MGMMDETQWHDSADQRKKQKQKHWLKNKKWNKYPEFEP